ncbi:caspase-8-like isoform X1 [Polypterus senegalus]|uniref:caspase-8-like isoform X1 n=2 Tax=Polypterus senegalus TaxID=55291 RepID=UPI001965F398|nr:caspase-8-like isoform X1 [Polypterus senegalus]
MNARRLASPPPSLPPQSEEGPGTTLATNGRPGGLLVKLNWFGNEDMEHLHKIAEQLIHEDVAAMKFLCLDYIGRNRQEKIEDALSLFVELKKVELLDSKDFFIVAELLYLTGHLDLLRILNLSTQEVESQLQQDGIAKVSPYRKMLYSLHEGMDKNTCRAMKFQLHDQLSKCDLDSETSCLEIFTEMEKREMLAPNNLGHLMSILKLVMPKLHRVVEEFDKTNCPRNHENSKSGLQPQVANEYKMSSLPRGQCLIINNSDFSEVNRGVRRGSEKDVEALKDVFSWLGFEIHIRNNLKAKQVHDLLDEFRQRSHAAVDCFVCCILSHGEQQCVMGVDWEKVPLSDITSYFNGNHCRDLLMKPKVFFIQACQGKIMQEAVAVDADGDGMESDATASRTVPVDADFLIGMATVPQCLSMRDPDEGSWYIQALCHQLKVGCPRGENILTILTNVNEVVSKNTGIVQLTEAKQIPEKISRLTRNLVFHVPTLT